MSVVHVLGNASLDTTLRVPQLPAPGETLVASGILRSPGGKGLNQAVMAARAGAVVRFCAPLGTEPEAGLVRGALAAEGFEHVLPDVGRPSDVSCLMVAPGGENCIVSTGACADALGEADAAAFVAAMAPGDLLLIQGNLAEAVTRMAASRAGRVMLNTAPLRWDYTALLGLCDVVVANRLEALELTGLDDPLQAAAALCPGVGIVTLGADGCAVWDGGLVVYRAEPAVAVDTSGAGDVFCGVLAAGLAEGMPIEKAVGFAQRAAALSVVRAGCFGSFPSSMELVALRWSATAAGSRRHHQAGRCPTE